MKIKISYSEKTGKIRNTFNSKFPFLKIEFFNTSHAPGQPTSKNNLVSENILLGEINPLIKEGTIMIGPDEKVATIEQTFQEEFGLPVQVFRKQKNVWIETTKTDQLTLAQQNEKGKQASAPVGTELGDRYLEDGQY